jgi:hypothetical protein
VNRLLGVTRQPTAPASATVQAEAAPV